MRVRPAVRPVIVSLGLLAILASACSSTTKSSAKAPASTRSTSSCTATGVTSSSIKIGELGPLAGPAAPEFSPFFSGFKAWVDNANATGGVDGRKILVVGANDGGITPTQNLTAAQELVEQQHVYAVDEASDIDEGSGSYLHQGGIPVMGYNISNTWGQFDNMFGYSGNNSAQPEPKTTDGKFLRMEGIKKLAIIGVSVPASVTAAQEEAASAKVAGVDVVLDNTSASVINSVWTVQAQQVKTSGAQAVYTPMTVAQALPLYTAIQQTGDHLKFILLPQGYGLSVANQLGAAGNGMVFSINFNPIGTNPSQQYVIKALEKYEPGVPVTDMEIDGFLSGSMLREGLDLSGNCPSRKTLISKLRKVTNYDPHGFFTPPINLATSFGEPYGMCYHYVQIQSGKLVDLNNNHPVCGTVIHTS